MRPGPDEITSRAGAGDRADLDVIARFLARRDVDALDAAAADVLVLCGSAVLASVRVAADAYHRGAVARILVTGGVGHSTAHLQEAVGRHPRYRDVATAHRPEAAVLADVLRTHHDVPDAAITIEQESTNCGENAQFSVDLLHRNPPPARSLLLVQDPTMQRRTHACFERFLRQDPGAVVRSRAPFVPVVTAGDVRDPDGQVVWSLERFTALLLGEVRRLHDDEEGHGPRGAGFIDHVDVPVEVLDAHRRLLDAHPGAARPSWRPERQGAPGRLHP